MRRKFAETDPPPLPGSKSSPNRTGSTKLSMIILWQNLKPASIKPETRSWRTLAPDFGGGSGGTWAGNSGDKSPVVQTFRVGRAAPHFAPAFGLREL